MGFIVGAMLSFHVNSHRGEPITGSLALNLIARINAFKINFENVFVAPIYYAYVKTELQTVKLI